MVSNQDKERVFKNSGFTDGFVNIIHKFINFMDAAQMFHTAVAVTVTRTVNTVKLGEQEGRFLFADVVTDQGNQIGIAGGGACNVLVVFHDTEGDGIPVTVGTEFRVGHDFTDTAEQGRERGVHRIRSGRNDTVGQLMYFRTDAEKHGTPAFRTDCGIGCECGIGDGTVRKDPVKIGSVGILDKCAGTVDSNDDHMVVVLHDITSEGIEFIEIQFSES